MMNRLFTKFALALTALLPAAAFAKGPAQDANVVRLSLQDCIDYALHYSDTIKNARLAILKQEAVNNETRAAALPHINGSGQFNDFVDPQQSLVPLAFLTQKPEDVNTFTAVQFTPKYNATGSLSGSQALFDGSVLVALKARKTVLEVFHQSARLTEENLRYNIRRAYYAVVIGEQQFKTVAASLAVARDMMHDVEVTFQNGLAEKIDVTRSEVQTTNLEADSIRIASMVETGKQLLKYSIGMSIDQPVELTDTAVAEGIGDAARLLTEQLDYNRRTEIALANTVVRLNEYNLQRYKLSAYPSLNAIGNMGYTYGSNKFSDLTQSTYLFSSLIGLQLNIPIFNGLLRQNQVRETKLDVEMAKNRLHQLKLSLDFQTEQAQTALRNALLSVDKQKRNLELSNTVLDLARKKYKAGVGSNVEVNLAQTDLLQAQNNYYSALLDAVNAQADVQKALGDFAQ
jgi:outer membrane protein TolC